MLVASLNQIDEELNRLEQMGVLSKTESSKWASPTVCVIKKCEEICVCADFSTGLNNALKDYHYPLLRPEEIFVKLGTEKFFQKSI